MQVPRDGRPRVAAVPRSGDVTPQILAEPVLDEPVGGCLAHSKDLGIPKILWQELWQISWLFLWQELWPVHGKGDKIRVVPLSDDVALELMVLPSGWAFPGQVDGHLSPEYVDERLCGTAGFVRGADVVGSFVAGDDPPVCACAR